MCNESALNKNDLVALHACPMLFWGNWLLSKSIPNIFSGNGLEDKVDTGIYVSRVRFCQTQGCWHKNPSYFKEKNPFHLVEEVYSVYGDQNTQRAWEKKFEKFEKKSRTKGLKLKLTGSLGTQQGGPSIWMRKRDRSKFEMGRWFSFLIPSEVEAVELLWRNCWQAHCDFMDTHNWDRSEQSPFPTFPYFPGEIEESILRLIS